MGIKFANSAFATLASGINSSATSITLTTGQGARFPSLSAGDYFFATLIDTSNNLEIVKCTARSTDVLTVTRGQESTTARAFSTGDRIELRITAQGIVDSAPVQSVAGKTGAVTLAAADIASGVFDTARLASSGTASSSTFLRGDQSWQTVVQKVLQISRYEYTSITQISGTSSETNFWSVTYNRLSATSDLWVVSDLPTAELPNGVWVGTALNINGYKSSKGLKSARPNTDATLVGFNTYATAAEIGSTTGNITISHLFNWGYVSGGPVTPINWINFAGGTSGASNRDSRISSSYQTYGTMVVMEIAP